MPANRCSSCCLNWPHSETYRTCAKCQGTTAFMFHQAAMGDAEAASLAAHLKFERFLKSETAEQREARQAAAVIAEAEEIAMLEALIGQTNPEPQEAT